MKNPIKIWPWEDAPEELKKLSGHGGDEDFVCVIPPEHLNHPGFEGSPPYWLERMWDMHGPQTEILPDGTMVVIGAHA